MCESLDDGRYAKSFSPSLSPSNNYQEKKWLLGMLDLRTVVQPSLEIGAALKLAIVKAVRARAAEALSLLVQISPRSSPRALRVRLSPGESGEQDHQNF